jgi:plasmid stabilization system protein ParE
MSLVLQKADDFREDFALRALWYVREAGAEVARRFQESVDATLQQLCLHPEMGVRAASGIPNFKVCGPRSSNVRSSEP